MKHTVDQQIMAVEALRDRSTAQHEVDMFNSILASLNAAKLLTAEWPNIMRDLTEIEGHVLGLARLAGTIQRQ